MEIYSEYYNNINNNYNNNKNNNNNSTFNIYKNNININNNNNNNTNNNSISSSDSENDDYSSPLSLSSSSSLSSPSSSSPSINNKKPNGVVQCNHIGCESVYTHHTGLSRHFRNFHKTYCPNPDICDGCISKRKKESKKPVPKVDCNHEACIKKLSKKNIAKHHKMLHPNCSVDCQECSSAGVSILLKLNRFLLDKKISI
ncbi:hypothetical protein ACTFIZ_011681 [Dictyostelium cf. discoideum]